MNDLYRSVPVERSRTKFKVFRIFIAIIVIVVFGTLSTFGMIYLYERNYKDTSKVLSQETLINTFAQGATYGVQQTLNKTIELAKTCKPIIVNYENQSYRLLWTECLKGGET